MERFNEKMMKENLSDDPTIPMSLSDQDKTTLQISNMQLQLTKINAEKAAAQNESATYAHKYLVLQLYLKYGLSTEKDGIDEHGNIVRNYAAK